MIYEAAGMQFGIETYACKHSEPRTWSFRMHRSERMTWNAVCHEECERSDVVPAEMQARGGDETRNAGRK